MSIRTRLTLAGDRGSISSAVVFTIFTSLLAAAIVTAVVSHVTGSTRMTGTAAMHSTTSFLAGSYLNMTADGQGAPTELCIDGSCTTVTGTTTDAGVRTVDTRTTNAAGNTQDRSVGYREITGTTIAGFDAAGNPVWQAAEDLTPHTFTAVVVAAAHSCGIDPAGAAWCWGSNSQGQLGDGTTTASADPVKVSGGHVFASLSTAGGSGSTCGLDTGGKAWCWGANTNGELGVGDTTSSNLPVQPTGGHTFKSLSVGSNTVCGIDTADGSWCWGVNPGGDSQAATTEPVTVAGGRDYTGFVLAPAATCALGAADSKAWCWSSTTGADGLVTACTTDCAASEHLPAPVEGSESFTSLAITQATGAPAVCGLQAGGATWCWGEGASGRLGDGTTTSSTTPKVLTGRTFQSITASAGTFCGLESGTALCWGVNTSGQAGRGTTTAATSPQPVSGTAVYTRLASSTRGSFCGLTDAAVECWGLNDFGQSEPGTGDAALSPTPVGGLVRPAKLSVGGYGACSLNFRSEGHCWGRTARGDTLTKATPYEIGRVNATVPSYTGYVRGGH